MESKTGELSLLVEQGRKQGYLTYEQVSNYLPDEANSAEKLDELLVALDRLGIEIVEADDAVMSKPASAQNNAGHLRIYREPSEQAILPAGAAAPTERGSMSSDPVRLYLAQMCQIPLLNRDQEIALAKKIEITRRKFRRAVLGNDYALRHTVEILRKVAAGVLPFDRTIKVSLTEQLTKEQITARMPVNLGTLDQIGRAHV